jgi:hypothetical protein
MLRGGGRGFRRAGGGLIVPPVIFDWDGPGGGGGGGGGFGGGGGGFGGRPLFSGVDLAVGVLADAGVHVAKTTPDDAQHAHLELAHDGLDQGLETGLDQGGQAAAQDGRVRALRRRAGELEAAAANSYRLDILDVAPRAVSQWVDKYRLILKGERMQTIGWVPADLLAVFNSDPRIIALNTGAPLMLRYASLREVGARQRIFNRAALASLADSQQPGLPTLMQSLELQGFRDVLRKEPDLARPTTEMTTLDQLLQYSG